MCFQSFLSAIACGLTIFAGIPPRASANESSPNPQEMAAARRFAAAKFAPPKSPTAAGLVVAVNNGPVELNSHYGKPLKIVEAEFARGIACHAPSKIVVNLPGPGKKFSSKIGLDNNHQTVGGHGSLVFSVNIGGRSVFRSEVFQVNTPAKPIEIDLIAARQFVLEVGDAGDGIGWDQADWADARVELADGETVWLGDLPIREVQDGLFTADPPFSFTYGGKPSAEFLAAWKIERDARTLDEHRTAHTVTYSDPAGGLIVGCEAVAYDDFPTVEWTLHFKNAGKADTPILENIQSLDIRWARAEKSEFLLHHNVGAPSDGTDYTPLESVLRGNSAKRLAAAGGRSTNAHLSYFNLERGKDQGLIVVVGWPGQWAADFIRDVDRGLQVRAGQEMTHFKLLPGEEVRTPLTVLQFWKGGDWIRAQNVWRRWMIAHNMPRPGGKLPAPMLLAYLGGAYEEMYKATEQAHFEWFNRYREEKIPLDYWWMDAGWYRCDPVGWPKVGTWEVDKKRFPRGLRAVSDLVHSKGMKTLLWFEPERVAEGTWLAENHPEWILGGQKGGILNFGNPDALKWITDRVDTVLNEEGIDLYRQDFNIDPLKFWRAADAPDRQGIAEIRHVTNLLAYWDELRRRHPNMLIDECASGGRRNDLEMMRRAVPLWRSDRTMEPIGQQSMTYGISMWIPYFGTGTVAWGEAAYFITGKQPIEEYAFWSSACPSLNLLFDVRERGLDYDKIRKLAAQWREVMPCYYGDYYPLLKTIRDDSVWIAWQFDRPDRGDGVLQAFRRAGSAYESVRLKLRGLNPQAQYQFSRFDREDKIEMSGAELLEKGLTVAIGERPGVAVFKYRRLP
ncbi:MAG: alpha-galactosidase [Pirellulales bacterium]|nr:alpha-galactosidase [Pirellulales bacterium]